MAQTKRAIEEGVNILLLGKFSNKSRTTGEVNMLRAFKLSGQEEDNNSEDSVPFKV